MALTRSYSASDVPIGLALPGCFIFVAAAEFVFLPAGGATLAVAVQFFASKEAFDAGAKPVRSTRLELTLGAVGAAAVQDAIEQRLRATFTEFLSATKVP